MNTNDRSIAKAIHRPKDSPFLVRASGVTLVPGVAGEYEASFSLGLTGESANRAMEILERDGVLMLEVRRE